MGNGYNIFNIGMDSMSDEEAVKQNKLTYTIFIVEDDEKILEIIESRLRSKGFKTQKAMTGKEAIEKVQNYEGDKLLLIDYFLPDMTGRELIEQLKGHIPFIAMTAYGSEKIAATMLSLGAREYLVKDGDFNTLLIQVVEHVIAQLEKEKKYELRTHEVRTLYRALEHSASVIAIADSFGQIKYVNDSFLNTTGYNFKDIVNQNISIFGGQDSAKVQEIWDTVKSGKKWQGIVQSERKDGQFQRSSIAIIPVTDENGKITHFIKIAEDISRIKDSKKAPSNKRLKGILDTLCWELYQGIQIVSGYAELLLGELNEHSLQFRKAKMVQEQTDKMQSMVNQLKAFIADIP